MKNSIFNAVCKTRYLALLTVLTLLCTLSVGNVWGATATFTASDQGWSGTSTKTQTVSGVTFSFAGGTTNPTYYTDGLRTYENCVITISSSNTITGITFTYTVSNNGTLKSFTTGTWTSGTKTWSGSATTISCTVGHSSGTKNGQVRITEIVVTYTASCTKIGAPTVTATPGDGRIDLSWSNQTGASSYSVTKTPAGGTVGTPSKSGSTWSCAITGLTNGTTYTWSVEAVGSGDYCASGNTAASASATPNVFRTITYYDKDGQHTTSLADGTNIATALTALYGGDDPVSCDATNYEYFVGWKVGEISGTASSVTLLDDEVVNASSPSNNYYAVWSDTDPSASGWTKVTSIAVGDVVVFAYDDDYKEMTGVTTTGTTYGSAAAVDPYPDDLSGDYALTVEAGNGGTGFSFKHGSVYLSWSSGNSLTTSGTKADASSWTISESSSGNFKFANVGTTTRILQYNSGSPRWACYTSSQKAFQIYKQSGGGDAEYITTCCDNVVAAPTVSATNIHYNQFTLSWTNVTGADSYNVTCTGGTPGAIQSDGTTRTCTITGLASPNTSYSWTVVATYSGSYCGATPAAGSTTTAQVYAVEYNANGGTVSPLPSTVSYEAGVTVTVAAEPGSTSKSGCTFTGWNTQADGQGTHYAASGSATFTMPSSTMTLYAEWTKKKNYYVDRMHGTNDGHTVTIDDVVYNCYLREGAYTVPTISDNTSGASACHSEHDHLLFWVTASSVNDDGTLKNSYTEVTPGSSKTATTDGTVYYAIWGKLAD